MSIGTDTLTESVDISLEVLLSIRLVGTEELLKVMLTVMLTLMLTVWWWYLLLRFNMENRVHVGLYNNLCPGQ